MWLHKHLSTKELHELVKRHPTLVGGNILLKLYGKLTCASGKRMNTVNRVFFRNEHEAQQAGYRPCAHCMPKEYFQWKRTLRKKQVGHQTEFVQF
jgi:methylphosphotriester-DNA--protein-cysteine methyltransferase